MRLFHITILTILVALIPLPVLGADWSLQITAPLQIKGAPHILLRNAFFVVLTNTGKTDQSICGYNGSIGYEALTFTLTTKNGDVHKLTPVPRYWTANSPDIFVIKPNHHYVWQITLDHNFNGIPPGPANEEGTLTAHYSIQPPSLATSWHVYSGSIDSEALHVTFSR